MGSIDLYIITAFALGVIFTLIVSKLARTIFLESIIRPLDRDDIVIYPGGELTVEKDADVELFSAITTAMMALTGNPTLTDEAINMLEKSLREHPGDRRAAILLGRLYAGNKTNLPKAIQVLSGALEAIARRGIEQKGYGADILYNLACYYVRMAQQAESNVDKERFRRQALEYLAESVRLRPENASDAAQDADFAGVAEDPDFAKILEPIKRATAC